MKVAATLWRVARLGFFVGWGAASVVVAACGGRPSGPVEPGHDAATEAGPRDAGSDVAAHDGGTDGPVDAGWDVPLE